MSCAPNALPPGCSRPLSRPPCRSLRRRPIQPDRRSVGFAGSRRVTRSMPTARRACTPGTRRAVDVSGYGVPPPDVVSVAAGDPAVDAGCIVLAVPVSVPVVPVAPVPVSVLVVPVSLPLVVTLPAAEPPSV